MREVRAVHLSFDFEECDLPRESGVDYPVSRGVEVSAEGAHAILDVLRGHGVKATFFCTLTFAERAPDVMKRIVEEGHEVAAHGVDHFRPRPDDPQRCREGLMRLTGAEVAGYRQPRMAKTDPAALAAAGYRYDASLNPAFVPGRYMHLSAPKTPFREGGLLRIPASVTPVLRIPLFWLSLHLMPEAMYFALARRSLESHGLFVTYFHPWEFSRTFAAEAASMRVSPLIRRNLGEPMSGRLDRLVSRLGEVPFAEFLPLTYQTEL